MNTLSELTSLYMLRLPCDARTSRVCVHVRVRALRGCGTRPGNSSSAPPPRVPGCALATFTLCEQGLIVLRRALRHSPKPYHVPQQCTNARLVLTSRERLE